MEDITVSSNIVSISSKDTLNEILLQGAQQMLAQAIENEVIEYLERHADQRDENGRRLVVRNGYLPARDLQTGVGLVEVCQPRVNDKRRDEQGQRQRFGVCGMPWIVGIGIVGEEAVIKQDMADLMGQCVSDGTILPCLRSNHIKENPRVSGLPARSSRRICGAPGASMS